MTTLINYIKAENAKRRAWVAVDPKNRWSGMIPENMDHWAEDGIFTVEQFEMSEMLDTMSDLAKSVYGTRSACPDTDGLSYEEVSSIYDSLLDELNEVTKNDELREKESIVDFESLVSKTITMGAGNRETAIKWIIESEDNNYMSNDDLCYTYGIPYGYLDKKAA